jgi:V/A-type H+-transporting ATPase subunit E
MSVEAIVTAIEAQGAAALERLQTGNEAQVAAVLAEAGAEAQRKQEAARQLAAAPAAAGRARLLQQARLDALLLFSNAREQRLAGVLAEARTCLARLRERADYPAILQRLAEEALATLHQQEVQGVIMHIDPRDQALVYVLLPRLRASLPATVSLTVNPSLHGWGGVIIGSEDGQIMVDNTLESRLEQALPYLRQEVAELLDGRF